MATGSESRSKASQSLQCSFSPEEVRSNSVTIRWCNWKGDPPSVAGPSPSPESVAEFKVKASPRELLFRDPDHFVAGEIHRHMDVWEKVANSSLKREEILTYIKHGVNVEDFFIPFNGDFQGTRYSSAIPPAAKFPNNKSCIGFEEFIEGTILERLKNGSMSLWGKADQVHPPHIVMPITIEPTKPRMCHDERYLNLWTKDLPFTLDYISNLPRYVGKGHFQTTMDDKSGYDHVLLTKESRTYFGVLWKGWYFVFNTIPFGWKASPYLYHTIGMVATSYIRSLGVPCSQYIDDRHVGQLAPRFEFATVASSWSDFELAESACFICASVLTSLGYFIGLAKSSLLPLRTVTFLGFLVDSERSSFLIPEEKKGKFVTLCDSILEKRSVPVKTLQGLAGKISSLTIAVPAAKLYAREIYRSISGLSKSSRVEVSGPLRKEIKHWRSLDVWKDCPPWPHERHTVVRIFANAPDAAWRGTIQTPGSHAVPFSGYWPESLTHCPIAIKEVHALVFTLRAAKPTIMNTRLAVFTDNKAFLLPLHKKGGNNSQLDAALKELYLILSESNASMSLEFASSSDNPADASSRVSSDCMLSETAWRLVEKHFGSHSIDLMALDSNVQRNASGQPLRHFTPFPSPSSDGTNIFAQYIAPTENSYVFPPFFLVGPVLKFLRESMVSYSMVVPRLSPLPYWWPLLSSYACASFKLGSKGDSDVVLFPSSQGKFVSHPLPWDLFVFKVTSPTQ